MKKLITGGEGLIGSEFDGGIKISRKDFDSTIESQVEKMFEVYRPDFVIHIPAIS